MEISLLNGDDKATECVAMDVHFCEGGGDGPF